MNEDNPPRLDGSGDWSRPSDHAPPTVTPQGLRLKLEFKHDELIKAEVFLRVMAADLSVPGVTDEIPEANAQLMLAVRDLEYAQHRIRCLQSLLGQ